MTYSRPAKNSALTATLRRSGICSCHTGCSGTASTYASLTTLKMACVHSSASRSRLQRTSCTTALGLRSRPKLSPDHAAPELPPARGTQKARFAASQLV